MSRTPVLKLDIPSDDVCPICCFELPVRAATAVGEGAMAATLVYRDLRKNFEKVIANA